MSASKLNISMEAEDAAMDDSSLDIPNISSLHKQMAPFNPTEAQAQHTALRLFQLTSEDVLFDLGCGDGRLLLTAVSQTPGLHCVGIELDPIYATRAQEATLPWSDRVDVRVGDIMDECTTLSSVQPTATKGSKPQISIQDMHMLDHATAIFLYLLPKGLRKVKPFLREILIKRAKEGRKLRIVSYMFSIPDWTPVILDRTSKGGCALYLYDGSSPLKEEAHNVQQN
jgi:SAM-dependent methyltransferase|mmetsp:Transcript_17835/g.32288  ORF Transcript_17835/g.32288 Transcript_17835/m.32288 type:complete len:227 (-) Transcript_17835:101-781(-)